jgi:hypothetical protein
MVVYPDVHPEFWRRGHSITESSPAPPSSLFLTVRPSLCSGTDGYEGTYREQIFVLRGAWNQLGKIDNANRSTMASAAILVCSSLLLLLSSCSTAFYIQKKMLLSHCWAVIQRIRPSLIRSHLRYQSCQKLNVANYYVWTNRLLVTAKR